MNCHDRYTYRVTWSGENEMFVGLCAEFGLLSHLDDTPEKAFSGIRDVAAFAVKALDEDDAPIPEPLSTRRYRGAITVRIPPETHRALAMDAAEAGVSLNRLAAERLSLRRQITISFPAGPGADCRSPNCPFGSARPPRKNDKLSHLPAFRRR